MFMNFSMEEDAGERFFSTNDGITDYTSASIELRNIKMIDKFIVGDYHVSFGQGLVMGGYNLGKSNCINGDILSYEGITRHSSTSEYGYTVTIESDEAGSIIIKGKIYFGYREPEIGDYAYADGKFSKTLIKNKTLVGMLFAKKVNASDKSKLDLLVLGTDTVTGICGPDYYTYNQGRFNIDKDNGSN